jgi:hypothetical protein
MLGGEGNEKGSIPIEMLPLIITLSRAFNSSFRLLS